MNGGYGLIGIGFDGRFISGFIRLFLTLLFRVLWTI